MFEIRPRPAERETMLQHRIRERLALLKRNPREVSLKAGLGPDAIRTILSGRSRSPRADTLQALAAELQCEVGYLLGTINEPWASDDLQRDSLGRASGIARLKIYFRLSASWIESELYKEGREPGDFGSRTDVFSLPDYRPGFQHLEVIEDDHANEILPRGSYALVLSTFDADLDIKDRDLVVLQRQRLAINKRGSEMQRTLRRARIFDDRAIILQTPTTNPDLQDEVRFDRARSIKGQGQYISKVEDAADELHGAEAYQIDGIVLRAIIPISGPPIERSDAAEEITHGA